MVIQFPHLPILIVPPAIPLNFPAQIAIFLYFRPGTVAGIRPITPPCCNFQIYKLQLTNTC